MKTITLYRSDYREHSDDGSSLFETVLSSLNIPKEKWDSIDEIDIEIESFQVI